MKIYSVLFFVTNILTIYQVACSKLFFTNSLFSFNLVRLLQSTKIQSEKWVEDSTRFVCLLIWWILLSPKISIHYTAFPSFFFNYFVYPLWHCFSIFSSTLLIYIITINYRVTLFKPCQTPKPNQIPNKFVQKHQKWNHKCFKMESYKARTRFSGT